MLRPALPWLAAYGLMLAAACWTDVRTRRIPNALVAWGSAAGVAIATMPEGIGFTSACAGLAAGLGVGFLLYATRLLGAGDAKLLAATGAFVGFPQIFPLTLFVLVAGGIVGIAWAFLHGTAGQAWRNLHVGFLHATTGAWSERRLPRLADVPASEPFPYALAIAAGALAHYALGRHIDWVSAF